MLNFFTSIFQSANQRRLKDYQKIVSKITAQEPDIANLSEEKFKTIFEGDADNNKIVEVFAAVREAAKEPLA